MDGLISAALMHHHFKGQVECLPVRYNEDPPLELMKGKHVYLVDFTYPVEALQDHIESMASLTVIDHHQDAMTPWVGAAALGEFKDTTVFFDNNRSGAALVWFYLQHQLGQTLGEGTPPLLVQYAQEYDLWTKGLPMTDEVQSALRFNFPPHQANLEELADYLINAGPAEIEKLKFTGAIIQQQEKTMAESLIRRGLHFTKFLDYENIPVCAMPAELANQAGEIIYNRYPDAPFVVLFEDNYKHKSRKYSFRSRRDGGANVSQIAARIGGKGHYNSSGAVVDLELIFEQEVLVFKDEIPGCIV
jgi:oligoribonuclease NrnB/cAMP/cGMP phosphodiesterase (DHH superfamily)